MNEYKMKNYKEYKRNWNKLHKDKLKKYRLDFMPEHYEYKRYPRVREIV